MQEQVETFARMAATSYTEQIGATTSIFESLPETIVGGTPELEPLATDTSLTGQFAQGTLM